MTTRMPFARLAPLVAIALASLAGCVRGRGGAAPASPAMPADSVRATPPTPRTPITRADSLRADSVARADSLARAERTLRDSVVRDSIARDTLARVADPSKRRAAPRETAASRQCVLDLSESPPETRISYLNYPGNAQTFIGGGFVGRCQGENNRIRADSAEYYQTFGIVNLFGNVVYEEPGKVRLTAARATYFTKEQRINADGGVVATQVASGSTFVGQSLEYLRPLAGVRTSSRLVAPNRPTATIIEKDSAGRPGIPVTITANTMQDEGDTLLYAWGQVQIRRNNITGQSDSAAYDKLAQRSRLIRQARVENSDSARSFRLVGDTIDLFSRDRVLERVLALHEANATNRDIVMQAERIDLRLVEQRLDRAYASGPGRARTTTPQQELVADSIAVDMPGQRIRSVRAFGDAVATGRPDSLKIRSDDRDVLRGDSVVAFFDTLLTPGDTSRQARIREIRARGNASSLFQVPSKRGPTFRPAINYVRGQYILVAFDTGTVRNVTVDSSASGMYLEPDSSAATDSAARAGAGTPVTPPRRPPGGPRRESPAGAPHRAPGEPPRDTHPVIASGVAFSSPRRRP